MSGPATVLLASADAALAGALRAALEWEPAVRPVATVRADDLPALVREHRPDLLIVDGDLAGDRACDLCRELRAEPGMAEATVVLVVSSDAADVRRQGLPDGVDECLVRPVEPADLLATLRWTRRLRSVHDELRSDREELERLHEELRLGFEHLLELFASLMDMRLPGAAARGARVAELARGLAGRFEVPASLCRDLDLAARLHELGRVLTPPEGTRVGPDGPDAQDRNYVLATRALLHRVDGLRAAGDLVGGIFENWDGSGHPDHLQHGQIPLRARILRVVVDFDAALETRGEAAVAAILEDLDEHRGTRYDPMVVIQLQEMLASGPPGHLRDSRVRLAIADLEAGMVLAEDLCTDSGLKLLARGTRLSPSVLEAIRRRHRVEPLLEGAVVLRPAA